MLSFEEWQKSQQPAQAKQPLSSTDWQSPVALPDWEYDSTKFADSENIGINDFLGDYYGQMASGYLPELDTWAQQNAGRMVGFDPNRFNSIEDFGFGTARGHLRGNIEQGVSHDFSGSWDDNGPTRTAYFDANGNPVHEWRLENGTELFRQVLDVDGNPVYKPFDKNDPASWTADQRQFESAGIYHKDTPQEALAKLLARGGDSAVGKRKDFMGATTLDDLSKDHSGKWGKDYVYDESIAPLLNDPNWVQRDEAGNITNIRAELYPLLMRESLGEEYRDMSRGGTKRSGGFGDVVKGLVLGVATGGLGLAGAGAMGLASGTLGNALAAGAISGGLSSALTGGDILKGALTGGVTGGLTKYAGGYVGSGLNNMGVTNPLLNKTLTGGIIGSGVSGVRGGNMGTGFLTGATNALGQQLGNRAFGEGKSFVKDLAVNAGTGVVNSAITGRKYDPSSLINGNNLMSFADWLSSQNG